MKIPAKFAVSKFCYPMGLVFGLALKDPESEISFQGFIDLIKDAYDMVKRQSGSFKRKRMIDWKNEKLCLEDINGVKTRSRIDLRRFKPHKCHILKLHDGSGKFANNFENMWDLTPDTDLLMELPEEYTFETALADLIDNSLQAVWLNDVNHRRLISVDVLESGISIFDTGPGMDNSDENSIVKWYGKENIERILESLDAEGCGVGENFENYSRVSIRRLGRLLPDARWTILPFMDFRQRKGDQSHLLKRCCLRVKCFVETDAGFNPMPSKTDLAHHSPFSIALRNFGNRPQDKEKDVDIEIHRDGKQLTPLQLEREYREWLLLMHHRYDEEIDSGEDPPVLIVNPLNKKALGISSDVIRVHQALKRKELLWKSGQKIKVLKGAYAGCYKNNVYATIEYFLIEGFEGDSGGEARIICRPLGTENGCELSVKGGTPSLNIQDSLSLPISVIDSGKCIAINDSDWERQLEKHNQKTPSRIDLLNVKQCHWLEIDGKDIVKTNLEMLMKVQYRTENHRDAKHINSLRIAPSSFKGFHGLYKFPLGVKLPHLFQKAGAYTFSFSTKRLEGGSYWVIHGFHLIV
ncbi:hypothetical protein GOBAR_DD32911 [Gossypium barbadense]|nr:hypothetical protein GOBAR_DD32911 [Gossypium barbadense]